MQIGIQQLLQTITTRRQGAGFFLLLIWALYVFLSPIYVFPKGLPQPADIILMIGMLPGIAVFFLDSSGRVPVMYVIGSLFAGLTIVVNLTNYFFLPDTRFLLSALYYPYNFFVFCFVIYLFKNDYGMAARLTYFTMAFAIFMQLGWAEFFPDVGVKRMTAGFHNPNQLAYWALLNSAMIFFLKRHQRFTIFDLTLLVCLAYIQTLALSKAGLITNFILFCYMLFTPQSSRLMKLTIFAGLFSVLAYFLLNPQILQTLPNEITAIERVTDRMATLGHENDESAEGRGYNRIMNNPEYLLVGAGEGGFVRFRTWASSNELHSGLATILFSYGITGFFLFTMLIWFIFYKQPRYCWVILGCVILFSLTHQAFRFTHFWVFLAIAFTSFRYGRAGQEEFEQRQLAKLQKKQAVA